MYQRPPRVRPFGGDAGPAAGTRGHEPAEQKWALENPDAMREFGNLPNAHREKLVDMHRELPPDTQGFVRGRMGRR